MINMSETLPRPPDMRYPYFSPLSDANIGVKVPRYWFHAPPAYGRRSIWGFIRAYRIRIPEASSYFGRGYQDKRYVWMSRDPYYRDGMFIIDITKLDNNNLRSTNDGHMLHKGDIPRSAIVGKVKRR